MDDSSRMDSFENMSHTVMDSDIDTSSSWVTVMCRATRFHITVSLKDIRKSRFGTEYSDMVSKVLDDDDEGDYDALFSESSLYPKETRNRGTINPFHFMIPSADLPPFPEVPRSKVSDLRIVSETQWDDYMSEIPQKAIISDGTIKFFKPADKKKQFLREVDMHIRIRHAGLQDKIKVTNLHSIVVSDDDRMTIGLLLDLIPSTGDTLYRYRNGALASEHHAKWKQQVTDTVEQLHAHDLVWGDVHPGNIVIDTSFNAWVVDFGGGWIVEFVPRKKSGTKEGDWIGIRKIFDDWILKTEDE
ncbi:hypothetical protein V491_04857 [Pseudogymnoascus sp. VKM F-3775]|nr:hypothetical protein V491_04857 [Pseudogymnoascus sp. VKM F-3775]